MEEKYNFLQLPIMSSLNIAAKFGCHTVMADTLKNGIIILFWL